MVIFLILLLALCCYGMKFSSFHKDYMSLSTTTAIKGIFAVVVLLSHAKQYFDLGLSIPDRAFGFSMRYLGQLMVAAYFFYSGFGIAESAKYKKDYVSRFFKNRIMKTLLHFDLAVLLFLLLQILLRNHFEPENYFYCWIGWRDIGNSSWFVFTILALYLLTYAVLLVKDRFTRPELFMASSVSLLTIGLWLFIFFHKKPEYWWYDTLAVFPVGIWFSLLKNRFDSLSLKERSAFTAILITSFLIWRHCVQIDNYGICAILFVLTLTAVSTFVKVDNPILQWLGKHLFAIYILQRIPMIVFSRTSVINYPVAFTAIVLCFALFLAWAFTRSTHRIDTILFA